MKKDTRFLMQNLIAHRGMHNINEGIPENSIKAFEQAMKSKYIIELDVQLLKDRTVVVFHDDNLKRMTGEDKQIKDATYDEIKELRLQNTATKISLFKEALDVIEGKVPIIIELKSNTKKGMLEKETMKILEGYKGKYAIKSFNPYTLLWLKKNYPKVIRGQLSSDFKDEKMSRIRRFLLKNMLFNFITKPDFLSYDIRALPNKRVEKYRGKKIVLGWTVKNKKQMQKAKKYCDNFVCDNIQELK